MEFKNGPLLNNDVAKIEHDDYLVKLERCLLLILNDQPDHRDDTIMTKLLDSLQSQIGIFSNSMKC